MKDIPRMAPHVLIIEDDPCYRRLLERYIQRCGAMSGYASDGRTGMEKALAGNYDLTLVDIQLPLLDGFMVATLLREQGYTQPLIGMSSLRMEGMKPKALAVGFNDYHPKPISEKAVSNLLVEYTQSFTDIQTQPAQELLGGFD